MTHPSTGARWDDFARACGLEAPVRLRVVDSRTGQFKELERRGPSVLIGSREDCDICLVDPEISRRHAWLQVIDGQLACLDLDSRTGIHWGHTTRSRGWVLPGQPVQVGPYELTLLAPVGGAHPAVHPETRFSTWDAPGDSTADTGLVFLNAHSRTGERRVCRLTKRLTLIGGSDLCNLRLQHGSVDRVHAAFVTLDRHCWLIDLRSDTGVQVADRQVELACLNPDEQVRVGKFQLVVAPLKDLPRLSQEEAGERADPAAAGGRAAGPASSERGLSRRTKKRPMGLRPLNSGEGLAEIPGRGPTALSDPSTALMLEQMQRMQQQYLDHTTQMMSMVVQAFSSAHNRQLDVIRDELHRVHELNRELQELQARRESAGPDAGPSAPSTPAPGTAAATPPGTVPSGAGTPGRGAAPPVAPAGPAPVFNPALFPPGVVPAGFVPPAYPPPGFGPVPYPAPPYPAASYPGVPYGGAYPGGPGAVPAGWMPPPGAVGPGFGPGMFPPPPPLRPKPRPAATTPASGTNPATAPGAPAAPTGTGTAPAGVGPTPAPTGAATNPADAGPRPQSEQDPLAQAAHLDLSARISELEQERTTRWQRVMQILTGSGGT
ncbi:MAG: FHA domain-containing protein [Planctomycetaceae bacterium]